MTKKKRSKNVPASVESSTEGAPEKKGLVEPQSEGVNSNDRSPAGADSLDGQVNNAGSQEAPDKTTAKVAAPGKKRSTKSFSKSEGAPAFKGKALVVVESPAKCKTIGKYLGPDYEIVASMGHVMDLPKHQMGIDIENGFEPEYVVTSDRKKTLSQLKKKADKKSHLYLACDPDREGEAISWHLKNQLGSGKKVARVVFNEITKEAVQNAFKHPADIDMNLVRAQQARRVLDRLVGYNLSPLLWQKVGRGLSAGRVQSVALRLIVDQERKIRAFVPEEYWSIEAQLRKQQGAGETFEAKCEQKAGQKVEIINEAQAKAHLANIQGQSFVVKDVKRQTKKRHPSAPFTTSKLQQSAYNLLRFPASKTMRIAQQLYEGIEIGDEGSVGLITYMRTDSVRVSDTALKETTDYIRKEFGPEYLPMTPNQYRSKKGAQDAHEAVRPTSVSRRPQDVERFLSPDQAKLYRLIWQQQVASQMVPATVAQESAEIAAGDYLFKATGSRIEFAGYLTVFGSTEEKDQPLPQLAPGESLDLLKIDPLQHFTKPPARFTDATLVKALEERGIGRPSTYAPIIATLTERNYVGREGGALIPTELGMLVTDLLVQYFERIMDYEFTATMEERLDLVEEGQTEWIHIIKEFYDLFSPQLEIAKDKMQAVKRESEPTDEICDKCGKPMVIKWGRRGKFMSCSGWPACRNAKSISTNVACPQCKTGKLVMRRAKSGRGRPFYGCTRYPECNFMVNRLPQPGEGQGEEATQAGSASGGASA